MKALKTGEVSSCFRKDRIPLTFHEAIETERLATIVDVNDEAIVVNKFAIKQDLNIAFARQRTRTKIYFENTRNTQPFRLKITVKLMTVLSLCVVCGG
jgi:hypothetical protein